MKLIPLTQGKFAKVDDEDYEWLMQFKWQASLERGIWYAVSGFSNKEKGSGKLRMHRLILGLTDRYELGDHIDHDGLNNQRNNLRNSNHSTNAMNKRKKTGLEYKGVCISRIRGHIYYRSFIMINGQSSYLGNFKTAMEAAKTYDKKALELFGEFAKLNFP